MKLATRFSRSALRAATAPMTRGLGLKPVRSASGRTSSRDGVEGLAIGKEHGRAPRTETQ
jgi:hypothetical protein